MEKPDSNGYVTITWPSKNIPHGGIFHTCVREYSTNQQGFLKLLLEESRLTAAQRRKSAYSLRQNEIKETPPVKENVRAFRPRTSCRRSLSAIRASGVFEIDSYKPLKRGEDREKLKERLASVMAFGEQGLQPSIMPRLVKQPHKLPTNKEMWHDLVTQIRERADWLAEMEVLGEADAHRDMVQDQIAERMRALDALGIDSECSSARSKASGFSVLDTGRRSVRSRDSGRKSVCSMRSTPSQGKKTLKDMQQKKGLEENVEAYLKISPLQYTPRRRV